MKTPVNALLPLFLLLAAMFTTADAADKVDFDTQIKPIFAKYCLECHGEDEAEGFRIDVEDEMMLYVNEGSPEASDLYTYMTLDDDDDNLMPPADHEPRPTDAEIELVKTWVVSLDATAEDSVDGAGAAGAVAEVDPQTQRIFNALGSLHTAAVHLPVGLLLAAGLFALLSLGGSFVMSDCAYYCLWLGTLGAIFAAVSGWYYSPMEHKGTVTQIGDLFDQTQPIFWHRTGGILSTVVALLLCLFAKGARGRNPDDGMMWKFGAILLAGAIGWVGHTGGEVTHGKDHYKDLNELVNSFIDAGDADETEDGEVDEESGDQEDGDESDDAANDENGGDDSESDAGNIEENLDV